MRRGEVWMVDFGIPSGPEQAGIRPAIVLQDDSLTPFISTIIVIPLTTNQKRLAIPTTFLIAAGEAGLKRDSVVLCHQVQVRGKMRPLSKLGELTHERRAQVEGLLLNALGL